MESNTILDILHMNDISTLKDDDYNLEVDHTEFVNMKNEQYLKRMILQYLKEQIINPQELYKVYNMEKLQKYLKEELVKLNV